MGAREATVSWQRDVDLSNVHDKKIEIDDVLGAGGVDTLVIDLSKLEFIDSLGLGVLIHARDRCAGADADLVLRHVPKRTLNLLTSAGLASLFTVEP